MRRRAAISSERMTVGDVLDYYEAVRDSIVCRAETAKRHFGREAGPLDPKLFGMNFEELDGYFEGLLDEIDEQASLFIIAAAEAEIRVDFENRVVAKKPKGSAVTEAFRSIAMLKGQRVPLEEILDVWAREAPSVKTDVSQFKGALKFRHWLAHGRWWIPKLGQRYDPSGLFLIIESLLTKTGLGDGGGIRGSSTRI